MSQKVIKWRKEEAVLITLVNGYSDSIVSFRFQFYCIVVSVVFFTSSEMRLQA